MGFFTKNLKNRCTDVEFNCNDVYVLTTSIVSSYNNETGCGPISVTWYFLATQHDNEYYELFSGKKLEKRSEAHGIYLDEPYIEKVEPLKEHLRDSNKKIVDKLNLFDFITLMNVESIIANYDVPDDDLQE